MITRIEVDLTPCPYCQKDVRSYWVVGENGEQLGMMSVPGVELIASWIYHSECWDKMVEEYNP